MSRAIKQFKEWFSSSEFLYFLGALIFALCFFNLSLMAANHPLSGSESAWYELGPKISNAIKQGHWQDASVGLRSGIFPALISDLGLSLAKRISPELFNSTSIFFWWRLPVIFFNFLLIIPIYFALKKLWNEKIALFSIIFISLSPTLIHSSSEVSRMTVFWSSSLLAFLLYLISLNESKKIYTFLSGIFLGIALLSNYLGFVLFPVFIFIFLMPGTSQENRKAGFWRLGFNLAAPLLIGAGIYFLGNPGTAVKAIQNIYYLNAFLVLPIVGIGIALVVYNSVIKHIERKNNFWFYLLSVFVLVLLYLYFYDLTKGDFGNKKAALDNIVGSLPGSILNLVSLPEIVGLGGLFFLIKTERFSNTKDYIAWLIMPLFLFTVALVAKNVQFSSSYFIWLVPYLSIVAAVSITKFAKFQIVIVGLVLFLFTQNIMNITLPGDNLLYFVISALILAILIYWQDLNNLINEFMEKLRQNPKYENHLDYQEEASTIFLPKSSIPTKKKNWFVSNLPLIIAAGLIIAGFWIRLYKLGALGLWWDEMTTGTYVQRILETGTPISPSGLVYYWRGVAYSYLAALFAFTFGNNEFWLRIPSVIFGMMIAIFAFAFSLKCTKDKWISLIVLAFLVFSTYNIEYSRFARFYVMNAALFMVAILFFWRGFFENKTWYKVWATLTFFVMIHTVQLGLIYLSLWAVWGIYLFIKTIMKWEGWSNIWKQNYLNLLFIAISLLIFKADNLFYRFIKAPAFPFQKASEVFNVPKPRDWNWIDVPKWRFVEFFTDFHIHPFVWVVGILFCIVFIIKATRKNQEIPFFSYIGLTLACSILLYEIGSRGVYGPRIYFLSEGLVVIVSLVMVYLTFKAILNQKLSRLATLLVAIIIFLQIKPYFTTILTQNYGDDVSNDPFRSTWVASYRSDFKYPYLYLAEHKATDDIWINVISNSYYYFQSQPDYILNQSTRWNTKAVVDEDGDLFSADKESKLIHTADDVRNIIKENPNKRVWILVNGASLNILNTVHITDDFRRFITENSGNVVYTSPDKISRIFLFDN